ncbi:MAG: L-threonylcarbamoyladenylate synthase [Pseudomonadota bacterium]|nr:MAG: threonylcarbamoyl-AMP synthase [Pseudomonadota bacterium]
MDLSYVEIERAVSVLKSGGLVAFPTETVYGLGADATNPDAVRRIFEAKGRPASHPLIVHVADAGALVDLARDVPPAATALAERFWPGPLTLVLERSARVLREVTGGQPTVAIRVPAHPVALALLRAFGGPVAAPSANRFGAVSPTTAEHVRRDLGARVDLVLEGGPAEVGLESTIVDVTSDPPRILRPGGIPNEAVAAALGLAEDALGLGASGVRAPGMLPSHYAPRAKLVLTTPEELTARAGELGRAGLRVGVFAPGIANVPGASALIPAPAEPEAYARALYASLRELDEAADVILVVPPKERGIGVAVLDRLRRAAAPRITAAD